MTIVHLSLAQYARIYLANDPDQFFPIASPSIKDQVEPGELFCFSINKSHSFFYGGEDDNGAYITVVRGGRKIYIDSTTDSKYEGFSQRIKNSTFGQAYSTFRRALNGKLLDDGIGGE